MSIPTERDVQMADCSVRYLANLIPLVGLPNHLGTMGIVTSHTHTLVIGDTLGARFYDLLYIYCIMSE